MTPVFVIIILILVVSFIGSYIRYKNLTTDIYGSYDSSGSSASGYGCEKYTGEIDSSHGYWQDDTTGEKWIDATNKSYLESGFSDFYTKTGVYPFLYVCDNYGDPGDFSTYEEKVYDDFFGECAGNLLFVFISNEETYYIAAGTGTGSVINDKTVPNVIQSKISGYWRSSSTDGDLAKIFGKALSSSADQLMKEAETTKLASNNFKTIMIVMIVAIAVIVILILLFQWWKKKKQAKQEEDERLEKILSQPLSTFGNMEINNLGQKYDNGSANSTSGNNNSGNNNTGNNNSGNSGS